MIITQTPLRISFFGGGTDFADFYREHGGCVLSSAIDKYIFVIVKRRFDRMIRVGYTKTELVDSVDLIEHELVREALRLTDVNQQIEIGTLGDIPATGSGLGSSSVVTVGLLNALHAYRGEPQTLETLAQQACRIEIQELGKPIGKQDQYVAAYGGLNLIRFNRDDSVAVEPLALSYDQRRQLNQILLLFFTNVTRKSESVLKEQRANIHERIKILRSMADMAHEGRALLEKGYLEDFGRLMDDGWNLKKKLASKISNPAIDDMYQRAKEAGAYGGKISGAGGGGFLLLTCPRDKQNDVRAALGDLRELSFHLEGDGSKVIFNYRRER